MVHYKLVYFPARNLAEATRMVFQWAGVAYEEQIIPFEDWLVKYKNTTPFGKIPVLYVDGQPLCESTTILRYVGKRHGLAGKTRWEKAKVDELISLHISEYGEIMQYLLVNIGFRPGNAKELFETSAKPVTQHYFNIYSRILKDNGTGFLVGKQPTIADFWVADYLHTLYTMEPSLFEKHLDLVGFVKRIYLLPKLKKYIENRPVYAL